MAELILLGVMEQADQLSVIGVKQPPKNQVQMNSMLITPSPLLAELLQLKLKFSAPWDGSEKRKKGLKN